MFFVNSISSGFMLQYYRSSGHGLQLKDAGRTLHPIYVSTSLIGQIFLLVAKKYLLHITLSVTRPIKYCMQNIVK